ncbi:MAG: hypothetical protein K6G22_06055 [Lachnospiraceae bacterium]|nr:hypothetical protein [Lachnospiraceae bacterium]
MQDGLLSGQGIIWWVIFLIIGACVFFYGIIYVIKKGLSKEVLAKASVIEFIANVFFFFPVELYNDVPKTPAFLHFLESLFTAILRTINIYFNANYERWDICESVPALSGIFRTFMVLANIILLIFVVGAIIQFFEGPVQMIRLFFLKDKNMYLFPDCNEKTVSIAKSLPKDNSQVVFFTREDELPTVFKEDIKSIEGICINSLITEELSKLTGKNRRIEIFLFADEEENNLSLLTDICGIYKDQPDIPVRIYVELSKTPWNLYDDFLLQHNSANGEKLVVNFLRTEENFAYNNLLKNSIFENAQTVTDKESGEEYKKIGFVLAGMNERNLEMLKAVLHLSQMPGYKPFIFVLDEGHNWDRILKDIPEIHKDDTIGDALYKINYFEDVDFETSKMEDYLDSYLPDFNFAFINAGDDLLNINLALRLKAYCIRNGRSPMPKIQVNVKDTRSSAYFNSNLTKDLFMVGDLNKTYDYGFITMSDIEKGTIAIHKVRYPEGDPTWISYCNSEYNRHSVYARTLSFKYKVDIIDKFYGGNYSITSADRTWKLYEHMRWNVYTRTLGYVKADDSLLDENGNLSKDIRSTAKVHNDLILFDDLPKKEQEKDALTLTPEIVKILKSI